jgi:hypothetical protein
VLRIVLGPAVLSVLGRAAWWPRTRPTVGS